MAGDDRTKGLAFVCEDSSHNKQWIALDQRELELKTVDVPEGYGIIGFHGQSAGDCNVRNLSFFLAHETNTN
jgi:hypothetical protein